MSLFIAIIAAGAYLTSIPCRVAQSKDRQAAWYFALAGILGASLLAILVVYQGDLFRPTAWHKGKVEMTFLVPLAFAVSCGTAFVPSLLVVWIYRKKFEDAHATA